MAVNPNFICTGVQKAGTSWLYQELKTHEDIFLPQKKELRQFLPWEGIEFEEYLKNFPKEITGEFTPDYFLDSKNAIIFKEKLPKCKVFVILRNPTERAFSQWRMARKLGSVDLNHSFETCFINDERQIKKRGLYIENIKTFQKELGENFRIYFYDDLLNNPEEFVKKICGFIESKPIFNNTQWFDTGYSNDKLKLTRYTRKICNNYYKDSIVALEKYLNIITGWLGD